MAGTLSKSGEIERIFSRVRLAKLKFCHPVSLTFKTIIEYSDQNFISNIEYTIQLLNAHTILRGALPALSTTAKDCIKKRNQNGLSPSFLSEILIQIFTSFIS